MSVVIKTGKKSSYAWRKEVQVLDRRYRILLKKHEELEAKYEVLQKHLVDMGNALIKSLGKEGD